jgi:diguanylate cyclase (GGDEF)-like protein
MKLVRRASLVLSLVLIVAIAVGYIARTSELENQRDLSLTSAAELGATELSSIVDATSVAARSATDPETAAVAMASVHRGLGVCVVDALTSSCSGDGPMPATVQLNKEIERRASSGSPSNVSTDLLVYDSLMSIEAVGPSVTVFVSAPPDIMRVRSGHSVKATTILPDDTKIGGFSVSQNMRQTWARVDAANNVYVVAIGVDSVPLPAEEYRFYLIIFSLAVVLLLLAGVTLFVEQRSLHERASFDALTKLPNRGEFERRAADLIANSDGDDNGICLLLFDLNGFKQVNDTYGHTVGDEMLKVVGSRLRKAVRDEDVVARWGGDEFVVVMPGIDTEEMGSRRAMQLAEQVGGRTRLDTIDEPLRVKVSVGVAIWPHHGSDLDELVVAADQAMYEAKRDGTVCRVATRPSSGPALIETNV